MGLEIVETAIVCLRTLQHWNILDNQELSLKVSDFPQKTVSLISFVVCFDHLQKDKIYTWKNEDSESHFKMACLPQRGFVFSAYGSMHCGAQQMSVLFALGAAYWVHTVKTLISFLLKMFFFPLSSDELMDKPIENQGMKGRNEWNN